MSAWTFLTLGVLARCAASCLEAILWPSVLVSEAPTLGDLVGTRLNSFLCSRGLSFPFCKRGFRRTGEHLVLQAGLPTADSKQPQRKRYWTAYAAQLFLSNSKRHNPTPPPLNLPNSTLNWANLTSAEMQNWQCPTEEGAMSTNEHSGAYSGSAKLHEATSMHAWEAKWQHTSQKEQPWSHSVQKKIKKMKVSTTVPNKSTSDCTLCLTHSSWSKEKALYC